MELLTATSPPRLRIRPAALHFETYQATDSSSAVDTTRLGEIITRLGEICLSPAFAQAILGEDTNCYPHAILSAMTSGKIQDAGINQRLAQLLHDCLPPPTVVTTALSVCAWRLESPSRACLFTGHHPQDLQQSLLLSNPDQPFAPHTLSKVLLEERSKRATPSGIHLLSAAPAELDLAPRAALLHYAQTALVPHHHKALDTTLEEAIACLVVTPQAKNHTRIALNQSSPWEHDHIDNRHELAPFRIHCLLHLFLDMLDNRHDTLFHYSSIHS